MATIPQTMKALLVQEDKTVAVKDHPVPPVGDDDILVKVIAAAQNPADWKCVDFLTSPGTILGSDFSGYVAAVGKNVASRKIGDHVAGLVLGGACTDYGAYAEYISTPAELSWVVPANTISHEQAASLGCATLIAIWDCIFWTSVQAFYHPAHLGLVEPPAKVGTEEWVFVYGGSSSVGQYAVQLAHLSGYKVVSTASPRNFELVKSFGADAVFDYNDPDVVEKIKSVTGDSIRSVFDTISDATTQGISARAVAPGGGRVAIANPEANARADVQVIPTLVYTSLGRTFSIGPITFTASPDDKAHLVKVPQLISEGKIVPNKVKVWDGGLSAVKDGLQYMREGKVSAEKIVYRV
ncbi:GroES-like protein [Amylocystis lapponica]|nr:GroES-like protein [Amylocystis lapponica]